MTIHVRGGLAVHEIAEITGGTIVNFTDVKIKHITTDSRDVPSGALFIAIRGERFDGNEYLASAFEKGAVCALAERVPNDVNGCVVVVKDTRLALGQLAKAYKEKISPLTVAVTGSVGKTTTKEFIYAVLSEKYNTLKTSGNFNNEIGLPMTLLGLSFDHNAVVLEMGMSGSGEIDYLSRIAVPNIGVVTNIGTSHIGQLGSREAIRDAKLEIRNGFAKDGILILNADEPLLAGVEGALYVGKENPNADCRIENIVEGEKGSAFDLVIRNEKYESITIPVVGEHNVLNAAFAWQVGMLAGLGEFEIRRGLMRFKNPGMRQNIFESNGITVMEDCYNAAPESMQASLKVLSNMAKRKKCRSVAVLGDMKELGKYAKEAHQKVGAAVAAYDIDVLVAFGKHAAYIAESALRFGLNAENVYVFPDEGDVDSPGRAILRIIRRSDIVLFKGSRAMAMERLVAYLKK
ncbi:MAG: UDP-N-acetylmuramoyl-tripeptide--D-alanyl-D-alanine ligase [Clostridia bacterium]|nr:UDP-N-acetylmuramoyl-tripeptide--D-alanyl-D-alanine ligase [Clostridia bacterium]